MTRAMPPREIRSRRSNSIFAPGVGVFGLPLRIFDKLVTTVTTFMVLFSPTSHTIFHHIVRTTSGTNQIGFHHETPQKIGIELLSSILYIKALPTIESLPIANFATPRGLG